MKLQTQFALISFCPDLTDPEARSLPVALLLVAEGAGVTLAAAIGRELPNIDRLTALFLRDVPRLLKDHISEMQGQGGPKSLDEILHGLHEALRNSLHVSKIAPTQPIEFDERAGVDTLYANILKATTSLFNSELAGAGEQPLGFTPATSVPRRNFVERDEYMDASVPAAAAIWKMAGSPRTQSGALA